ncbi:quinone oxidoreductase [SAR202 cluster bacterium AD-804-J14_MRT_500m]|nr:quinone oxidoreductase [SAR202 cluster bacterium AD-804-J14_MRT_500m]
MKAVQFSETGGPEVLQYVDVPDPIPGPNEVLVKVRSIGVNYTDVMTRAGLNHSINMPPLPSILGAEASGIVVAAGKGVTEVSVGESVAYYANNSRSYAELAVIPSWRAIRLPTGVSFDDAAATILQGMTAQHLCHTTHRIQKSESVLIHAAAGGVGLLLTQMIKELGATVIGTVSTEEKAKASKNAGADKVIIYTEKDFVTEIKQYTKGAGVNVVYDSVGISTFGGSIESLARKGHMVIYGQASGPVPPVTLSTLYNKSLTLSRTNLLDYTATREELLLRANDVFQRVQSGALKVNLYGKWPLKESSTAHQQLQGRETIGKVLLTPEKN